MIPVRALVAVHLLVDIAVAVVAVVVAAVGKDWGIAVPSTLPDWDRSTKHRPSYFR